MNTDQAELQVDAYDDIQQAKLAADQQQLFDPVSRSTCASLDASCDFLPISSETLQPDWLDSHMNHNQHRGHISPISTLGRSTVSTSITALPKSSSNAHA
jgi:hypothetical protein